MNLNLLFSTYKYSLQITQLPMNYITIHKDVRSNNMKIIAFNVSDRNTDVLMDMEIKIRCLMFFCLVIPY